MYSNKNLIHKLHVLIVFSLEWKHIMREICVRLTNFYPCGALVENIFFSDLETFLKKNMKSIDIHYN